MNRVATELRKLSALSWASIGWVSVYFAVRLAAGQRQATERKRCPFTRGAKLVDKQKRSCL